MFRFTLPRDIYFGENATEKLECLKGYNKAIIVTGGKSMQANGFIDKLERVLKKINIKTKLFSGVEPDPSIETVMRGAEAMKEFEPDVIIAIGGGSPLDAAKAMWVFYENPEYKFQDIITPFTMPKLRQKAIFVAIPSTSGTASEVTAFSVITDYSTKIKYPLADYEITPDIAVLDTEIPRTMPKDLIAVTGMDALTHAFEAYASKVSNPITDCLAIKAITMISENLERAYDGDPNAMSEVHLAQCMAGMAFSNALLGISHSLAHKTGATFGISHGMCNAILLPNVVEFNRKTAERKYADIASAMGYDEGTDKQKVNKLVRKLKKLNTSLNLPNSYKEAGVSEDIYLKNSDNIVENALIDPCTASNPRSINKSEMYDVLKNAYYGKKDIV